jgi:hypothetical protein
VQSRRVCKIQSTVENFQSAVVISALIKAFAVRVITIFRGRNSQIEKSILRLVRLIDA